MRILAFVSGFDGDKRYPAGEVDIHSTHAKRVIMLGHGLVMGEDGKPLSVEASLQRFSIVPRNTEKHSKAHGALISAIEKEVAQYL